MTEENGKFQSVFESLKRRHKKEQGKTDYWWLAGKRSCQDLRFCK